MDTLVAISARRSIRRYKPERVMDDDLKKILEAGRQAPSAGNRQPWHFIVVRDPETKRKVAEACSNQTWMALADVIVAGVGLPEVSEKWYAVDTAIALQNMILAATSLGYGTCWIGAFDEAKVKEILGVPENARVIALTPIGVPAEEPPPRPRKEPREVFSLDRFGNPLPLF